MEKKMAHVITIDENDIHEQGYNAAMAGKPLKSNPYNSDNYEGGIWEDGWNDYDENER